MEHTHLGPTSEKDTLEQFPAGICHSRYERLTLKHTYTVYAFYPMFDMKGFQSYKLQLRNPFVQVRISFV